MAVSFRIIVGLALLFEVLVRDVCADAIMPPSKSEILMAKIFVTGIIMIGLFVVVLLGIAIGAIFLAIQFYRRRRKACETVEDE